jgi:hypothetical protein
VDEKLHEEICDGFHKILCSCRIPRQYEEVKFNCYISTNNFRATFYHDDEVDTVLKDAISEDEKFIKCCEEATAWYFKEREKK